MKTIYVVVKVKYREHRVQYNMYVGSKDNCMNFISKQFSSLPIFTYKHRDADLAKKLDAEEKTHFWLQEFTLDEEKDKSVSDRPVNEIIKKAISQYLTKESDDQRKLKAFTGKEGYIEYMLALYKELGYSSDQLALERIKMEKELPLRMYQIP